MKKNTHRYDPSALIGEAFAIEGITEAECRGIFFDWALGLEAGTDPAVAAAALIEHHAGAPAGHPMLALLKEALQPRSGPRRRGRRRDG